MNTSLRLVVFVRDRLVEALLAARFRYGNTVFKDGASGNGSCLNHGEKFNHKDFDTKWKQ